MNRFAARRLLAALGPYWLFLLLGLAILVAVAAVPDLPPPENLANVVAQGAPLAVLATGQTFVILCGLIDLTVGQLLGLVVVLEARGSRGNEAANGPWHPALLLALGLAEQAPGW